MTIGLDVSCLRSATIDLHGLTGVDAAYNFFYDETNNIRKLSMHGANFSVPHTHNFVLGGIAREEDPSNIDANLLIESLSLQKTTKELKLKHIGSGDFSSLIKSRKLKLILEWIKDNHYFIHFVNLNIVYWSIVDIVDSVINAIDSREMMTVSGSLKSDLYELVKSDEERWMALLSRYSYPNVDKAASSAFLFDLVEIIEDQVGELSPFRHKFLVDFFKLKDVTELIFLDESHDGVLIENFSLFYATPLWLFKNSVHTLDNESTIEAILENMPITYQGNPIANYKFRDSKDEPHIQISDIVSGLFGKLFSFVKDSKMNDVSDFMLSLDLVAAENMSLLAGIMQETLSRSNGFHHHIISEGEHKRLAKLLYTA